MRLLFREKKQPEGGRSPPKPWLSGSGSDDHPLFLLAVPGCYLAVLATMLKQWDTEGQHIQFFL